MQVNNFCCMKAYESRALLAACLQKIKHKMNSASLYLIDAIDRQMHINKTWRLSAESTEILIYWNVRDNSHK